MGFLRFVLESEGYEVVAQASSASELARVLAVHQPDVVVLDDGIGATAVQMTHEVSPNAKVILVWPGAVVPIGGYARVDPGDVLRSLGPTVARAVGTMPVPRENVITPGWADRLKNDPAALREKLEEHDGPSTKRPSVTDLQRRGQHLHPVGDTEPAAAATLVGGVGHVRVADEDLAPVLPLSALSMPPAAWASTLPESALVPITARAAGTAEPPIAAGEWNRRLGIIALGGAVAASAVVMALTLGGAGGHQGPSRPQASARVTRRRHPGARRFARRGNWTGHPLHRNDRPDPDPAQRSGRTRQRRSARGRERNGWRRRRDRHGRRRDRWWWHRRWWHRRRRCWWRVVHARTLGAA